MTTERHIKIKYRTIDGCRKYRTFKTIHSAQKFAHTWVGKHPDFGSWYAVSNDGVGTIEISGATMEEIFPHKC